MPRNHETACPSISCEQDSVPRVLMSHLNNFHRGCCDDAYALFRVLISKPAFTANKAGDSHLAFQTQFRRPQPKRTCQQHRPVGFPPVADGTQKPGTASITEARMVKNTFGSAALETCYIVGARTHRSDGHGINSCKGEMAYIKQSISRVCASLSSMFLSRL